MLGKSPTSGPKLRAQRERGRRGEGFYGALNTDMRVRVIRGGASGGEGGSRNSYHVRRSELVGYCLGRVKRWDYVLGNLQFSRKLQVSYISCSKYLLIKRDSYTSSWPGFD